MKYLSLIYIAEDKLDECPADECLAYAETLKDSGQCLAAEALQCLPRLTTVRVQNGDVSATDGPFPETKEYLAGIYVIDVPDLEQAVQLVARIPSAPSGRIELRPILEVT